MGGPRLTLETTDEAPQYEVEVVPSPDPNKGQYFWSLAKIRPKGIEAGTDRIAYGYNDNKQTCFEQAEETLHRFKQGPEVRRYA